MSANSAKLFVQNIARVCELLNGLSMDGSRITGIVQNLADLPEVKRLLQEADDEDDELAPSIQGNKITFYKVRQIFKDFEKLLNDSNYRRRIPEDNFYLINDKQAFYIDESNPFFDNYLKIIELYKFLETKADHVNTDVGQHSLVFLNNKKLLITDFYSVSDLVEIKDLDVLISKFSTDEYTQGISAKEKDQILKKTLINFFKDCDVISLSQIIQDFSKLNNCINDELDIYMSKFSYEDVKKEVEKEKVDFIVRLNKVFSDIQTQLIGVPVSVILAADKLRIGNLANEDPNKLYGISLTNILVIFAIGFYAIVLAMLIRNQKNTLEALKDEIDHHESLFNSKHKGMAKKFQRSFAQIKNRYEHQKRMLLWVDILVCLAFGLIYLLAYISSFSNLEILLPLLFALLTIGIIYFYKQYE